MRKINKKEIVILIILIIMLIIQIKAFNNSRANKFVDIVAKITDSDGLLSEENITITALNEAESGTSIILPEFVNTKKVSKYIVVEKNIVNNEEEKIVEETTDENVIENEISENEVPENEITENEIQEKEILEEVTTEKEMLPGEKIYLTEEEKENLEISLTVQYDKIETNEQTLYNKKLVFEQAEKEVLEVSGYMLSDTRMQVSEINVQNLEEEIAQNYPDNILIGNYNIELISGEEEYLPKNYSQTLKIKIVVEEGEYSYTVLEMYENEIKKNENVSVENGIIKFDTEEIKPYLILVLADEDEPSIIDVDDSLIFKIDDYESDKNYYLGLNYTENNSKNYTGKYTSSNLKEVRINYYGYNYDESSETATGKISDTEKQTVVSYRKCLPVDTSREYNHKIDR